MPDPTDKRIEELWQYIPPYTAPNHRPQVEVITTTNTGDTPMTEEDPDLLAGEALDKLRGRNPYPAMSERFRLSEELENARYQNNLLTEKCRELQERIDALKHEVEAKEKINSTLTSSFDALRRERDEARWEICGFHHLTGFLAGDYAISRGWNYFNDERKWAKFPPSVKDFDLYLKGQEQVWLEINDNLKKRIEDLKNGFEGCCTACEPVALMNKRLLEERTNDKRA